jgi:hypothetical protein
MIEPKFDFTRKSIGNFPFSTACFILSIQHLNEHVSIEGLRSHQAGNRFGLKRHEEAELVARRMG